jgi:hypothetical protein
MKKMLIRLMLVVLITVFLTSAAHSELYIYEPFDYPVGGLDGCRPDPKKPNDPDTNVGFGLDQWSDYSSDEPPLVESGSLIHPTYDLGTVGNHALIVDGMVGTLFSTRVPLDDGRDYWFSFLYQAVNLDTEEDGGEIVGFFADAEDHPEIEIYLTGGYPSMYSPYADEWGDADVVDPAAVQWMLIKIETSGSPDTTEMVYWWVDPMPGMEPDVEDADIALEYNVPASTDTYFFWWAGFTETDPPMFRFDEIRLGTEFTDVSDAPPCHLTRTPNPEDNEINVDKTNTTLSWEPPTCLEGDLIYDVYLGTIGDPNVGNNPLVVDNQAATSYPVPEEDLEYDTTYYWRVDVIEPNDIGIGYNVYEGLTWSFTTGPPSPVIKTEPQDATVPAGADAIFTVVVLNEPTYQWYYSDTPDGVGTEIPGATSPTLTITNVQKGVNEGYYYCVAVNTYGQAESFHARLLTERLMANWMFEGNLEDEVDPANNGTSLEPISYGGGVDEGQAVAIVDPNQFVMIANEIGRLKSTTVTAWLKPATLGGVQVILATTEGTDNGAVYLHTNEDELWGEFFGSAAVNGREPTLTEGQWNHCVLKCDAEAEEASLYLNGELVASSDIYSEIPPFLPPLSIGAKNREEGNYVDGLIDDVRIYNYPIPHLEIAQMYTDTIPGSTACLGNPEFDFNEDCVVNILDFEILASNWANCNIVPECQFSLP